MVRQSRRRKRPFLQGSEQVLRSRAHAASHPPVHFVPCPHVSPFIPQALLTGLSWDGKTATEKKATEVIKENIQMTFK